MWITCNAGNTEVTFHSTTSNVSANADFGSISQLLGLTPLNLLVQYVEGEIEDAFLAGWRDISESSTFRTPGFCLRVVITDESDGSFTVRIVPS
jgi:hypothetical protein